MSETISQNGEETQAVAELIAQAAARLFAERGYDATSMREIAAAAGVTKPTLYYHFGSKEGLAQALLEGPMARVLERTRGRITSEADPVAVIVGMTEDKFADCRANPDRWRFVLALAFGPHASTVASVLTRHADAMDAIMDQAIGRLAEQGRIETESVQSFSTCLRGMSVIHTLDFLYRGRPLESDLASRLVSDLLRSFGRTRGVSS